MLAEYGDHILLRVPAVDYQRVFGGEILWAMPICCAQPWEESRICGQVCGGWGS